MSGAAPIGAVVSPAAAPTLAMSGIRGAGSWVTTLYTMSPTSSAERAPATIQADRSEPGARVSAPTG